MTISLPATYTDYDTIYHTLPDVAANGITAEQTLTAAGEAEAEVNSYIAGIYTLSFTAPIPLLTTVATDIAIWKLLTSIPFNAENTAIQQLRNAWAERYKAALAILARIADGSVSLVDATGTVIAAAGDSGAMWSTTIGYVPTFGEGADQGFVVDRNKVDNESSRRVW